MVFYGPLFEWRKKFPDTSAAGMVAFEEMIRAYWGTLLSVDDSVGRLYDELWRMGALDNTLFIFTSDNGLLEGEHGMVDKRTAHEGSLRIPLVVRYPELVSPKRSKVIEAQTLTLDFAASILEICGAKALPKTQGRSWKSLITTGDPEWRTSWYYEYNYEKQFPYTPNVRALRTDRWKYIRYPHGDGSPDKHLAELYDLQADPERALQLDQGQEARESREGAAGCVWIAGSRKPTRMARTGCRWTKGSRAELPDESIR